MKNRILKLFAFMLIMFSIISTTSVVNAIPIPEKRINIEVVNLTKGVEAYLLIPEDLLEFNMKKFVDNNINNDYIVQQQKAQEIKKFLDSKDYQGYIEYLQKDSYAIDPSQIEIRHYCMCLGDCEIIGKTGYKGVNYLQVKIHFDLNNKFRISLKDYLTEYDCSKIKIMLDEFGSYTYIDVSESEFRKKPDNPVIIENNIKYTFTPKEDYGKIQRNINITYFIIWAIVILVCIYIIKKIIDRRKTKAQEIEDRKFWKKKPGLEEEMEVLINGKVSKKTKRKQKKMERLKKLEEKTNKRK